jgi:hypothetical protein
VTVAREKRAEPTISIRVLLSFPIRSNEAFH